MFASDIALACLFPIAVCFVLRRASPEFGWKDLKNFLSLSSQNHPETGLFSAQNAYNAYAQYRQLSANQLAHMRASYAFVGRAHKRIGYEIGYPTKLNTLHELTQVNAKITDGIAELAVPEVKAWPTNVGSADLARTCEALKHFMRDWSLEGALERDRIFSPILDVLKLDSASDKRVLIPGAGLCRLAWEVSHLGFDTTANEMSYFMVLAFRFLLSPEKTTQVNQHVIHPFAYWFSHQRSNENLFRGIRFPDVIPRLNDKLRLADCDFFSLPKDIKYDYIITLFFIDTSLNILATLEHIYTLLRPGGLWINLGPLLWTSGAQASLELSLDELLHAVKETGFTLVDTDPKVPQCMTRRTIDCEYTHDETAMMRWIYKAEFWVARK